MGRFAVTGEKVTVSAWDSLLPITRENLIFGLKVAGLVSNLPYFG